MAKGARTTRTRRVPVSNGRVRATFLLGEVVVDRLDVQAEARMVGPSLIVQRALDEYLTKLEKNMLPE